MLTLQIPTLLAVLATALMAVVIFAPERAAARPTISFAPPLAPAPFETVSHTFSPPDAWETALASAHSASIPNGEAIPDIESMAGADAVPDAGSIADADSSFAAAAPQPPAWPMLVDRRAVGCDEGARLALVKGLLAVGTPWARAILQRVLDDETDPAVRAAVIAAGIADTDAMG